jgi:hypothetical protein
VALDFCGAMMAQLLLYGLTSRAKNRPQAQVQPA